MEKSFDRGYCIEVDIEVDDLLENREGQTANYVHEYRKWIFTMKMKNVFLFIYIYFVYTALIYIIITFMLDLEAKINYFRMKLAEDNKHWIALFYNLFPLNNKYLKNNLNAFK